MTKLCVGILLFASMLACSNGKDGPGDPESGQLPADDRGLLAPFGGDPAVPSPTPAGLPIAVRLHGVHAPGAVRLSVASADLVIDGHTSTGAVDAAEINLGDETQAWRVFSFDLPVDATEVSISLAFAPTGSVESGGETDPLDLSGPPLSLVADVEQLRERSKVVVEVDLAESLIEDGGHYYFLPEFIVRY